MPAVHAPSSKGKEPLFLPKTPSPAPRHAELPTPPPSGGLRAGMSSQTHLSSTRSMMETPTRPSKRQRSALVVEDEDGIEFLFATPGGTRAVAARHQAAAAPATLRQDAIAGHMIDGYLDLAADYQRPVFFAEDEQMEFEGADPADSDRPSTKRHKTEIIVVDDEDDDETIATPLRAVSEDDQEDQAPQSAGNSHASRPNCGCGSGRTGPVPIKGRRNLPPRAMAAILRGLLNGHPYQRLSLHTQLNQAGVHVSWPDIPQFFGIDGKHHDAVRAAAKWLQENVPRMYEQTEYGRR